MIQPYFFGKWTFVTICLYRAPLIPTGLIVMPMWIGYRFPHFLDSLGHMECLSTP
jgi:hypothetical protein